MSRRIRLLSLLAALAVGCAVAFVLASARTAGAGDRGGGLPCPNAGDRMLGTALLHVPTRAKAPLPLVIAFHGAGGTGPGMADYSGLSDTADRYGFAVLYPTAGVQPPLLEPEREDARRRRRSRPRAAPAGDGRPRAPTRRGCYATGVSNGGGFAARVGCELAGTIAAIAPVAGGYKALDRCPDGRQTSVLEIHGTTDHVVPYEGRRVRRRRGRAGFLAGWVHRDGCDEKATRYDRPTTPSCASPTADATRGSTSSTCGSPEPTTAGRAPTRRGRAITRHSWRPTRRCGASSPASARPQRLRRRQPRRAQRRVEAGDGADQQRGADAAGERLGRHRPRSSRCAARVDAGDDARRARRRRSRRAAASSSDSARNWTRDVARGWRRARGAARSPSGARAPR